MTSSPIQKFSDESLERLQRILREDYGHDVELAEVAEIAAWLVRFYTALIGLAARRRGLDQESLARDTGIDVL